jgi:uncharacterized protein (TIGR01777 family)
VESIEGDPTQAGSWQAAVATCDAAVNLAGESVGKGLWTGRRKRQIRRSRLEATRNVAEAIARGGGPGVLVSASATGYYGDGGATALDEAREPGVGFLARLAREWEGTALLAESTHTRVVLLRIGVVLARDGGALPQLVTLSRLGLGGRLGSGAHYFPWIHIQDLVRVVLFALDTRDLTGPVNATAPDPPTQAVFASTIGHVLNRATALPLPALLLHLALGEKSEMLLASQRVIPKALRARGFHFEFDDLHEALSDLLS